MAIVKEKGKPDLFVIMTCNPNWPEIQNNLKYNQKWYHRKDLCNRVFKIYFQEAIKDMKENVLGNIVDLIYTIEWQKRGLSHAHFIIIFDEKDKIKTTTDLNSLISAEFPNPKYKNLHKIISENHIHGPYGCYGTYKKCQENNCCSKSFPKEFALATTFNDDAYPTYRRPSPEDGRFTSQNKYSSCVDNRFIVHTIHGLLRNIIVIFFF
jgi:hypothetical protein